MRNRPPAQGSFGSAFILHYLCHTCLALGFLEFSHFDRKHHLTLLIIMSCLLALSLALGLLCTLVRASNPVFGAYTSSACDSCLDAVYENCPGYYQDRSYATCMCKGDGGTNFVSCMSYCDPGLNEPMRLPPGMVTAPCSSRRCAPEARST